VEGSPYFPPYFVLFAVVRQWALTVADELFILRPASMNRDELQWTFVASLPRVGVGSNPVVRSK
jgi:hypothetical protein